MRITSIYLTITLFLLNLSPPLVLCAFDRGDPNWSGKPQSIGIDFSSTCVTAVSVDDLGNFTTLGVACAKAGNNYAQFIYEIFAGRMDFGQTVIIDDVEIWEEASWYARTSSRVSVWVDQVILISCERFWPLFQSIQFFPKICSTNEEDEEDEEYIPRVPKSKYQSLRVHSRMEQLRSLMPKWFRTPRIETQARTKSNFILATIALLDEIKQISLAEHNIIITSAMISIPSWIQNELSEIFDEACLLAGIEVLGTGDSTEVATKGMQQDENLLILNHGFYFLDISYNTWTQDDSFHVRRASIASDDFGTLRIAESISNRIIGNFNTNVSEGEWNWPNDVGFRSIVNRVVDARFQIKYRHDWPDEMEFMDRFIAINLTDSTGYVRVLNLTGGDVQDAEARYVDEVSREIQVLLWDLESIWNYRVGLPDWNITSQLPSDEQWAIVANIVENVTAPPEVGSWTKKIDSVVILDSGTEVDLLYSAAQNALGRSDSTESDGGDDGICIPSWQIAARGAALRALEQVRYWETTKHWEFNDEQLWSGKDDEDDEL